MLVTIGTTKTPGDGVIEFKQDRVKTAVLNQRPGTLFRNP
jgi:hypothetical protein